MDRVIKKKKPTLTKVTICIGISLTAIYAAYSFISFDFTTPTIDKNKIRIGIVKQGPIDVLVSGNGVITAKDPEWIVSKVSGQVMKSTLKAGEVVKKGDIIVELANEDAVSSYAKSNSELQALRADFTALKISLHSELVGYEADLRKAELDNKQANAFYDAVQLLWDKGDPPISQIEYTNTKLKAEQTQGLVDSAKEKIKSFKLNEGAQLNAFSFRLASIEEENSRLKKRMDDLKILANSDGILQNFNLKVGQGVNLGDPVAQIINPLSTYVTLSVPATQAYKISVMQKVDFELNKKAIHGVVHRIDPNVRGTTVDVDVLFDGDAIGAKIGMYVNGSIFTQSISKTLYIDTPTQTVENGNMSIYLVTPDGKYASMTTIKSGVLSSNYLQIVSGLNEGDKVILSELPDSNNAKKIHLN